MPGIWTLRGNSSTAWSGWVAADHEAEVTLLFLGTRRPAPGWS